MLQMISTYSNRFRPHVSASIDGLAFLKPPVDGGDRPDAPLPTFPGLNGRTQESEIRLWIDINEEHAKLVLLC